MMAINMKPSVAKPAASPATPLDAMVKAVAAVPPVAPVQSIAAKPPVKAPAPKNGLDSVMATIQKQLGDKSIVKGSEIPNPERLPSGIFELDYFLSGGLPFNRYSIIYGPESSGKTNLMYKFAASAQRRPGPCNKAVIIDLEGTVSSEWAAQFGVDVDKLVVAKPSYGEQAVDMISALMEAEDVAFLAVDSVAVLIAAKELDGSVEKADVGTASLLTKRLANKVAVRLSEEQKKGHNLCVLFLNQTRFKIGVMFGDPEVQPGGQTLKFNASMILRVSSTPKMVKDISSQVPVFKETTVRVKKAKVGITQSVFEYDMCIYAHDGLSPGDTASFSMVKGILQNTGKLVNTGKGWSLLGKVYPTLNPIQDTYYAEPDFAHTLQKLAIDSSDIKMSLVAPEPETPEVYPNGMMFQTS